MEYTYLGRTGMKVSRLCLGTMNFGPTTDEKEAFRIMDAALDAGINFFDTANMYGFRPDTHVNRKGWTEEIIGRWFAQGGGRRESVVLSTKVFAPMDDPHDGPNDGSGLSAYKIRRHLEGSLRRLQTDHVELYYMHGYDPHCTWEELWDAFKIAKYQGKIDYVGSSNFELKNIMEAQTAARERGELGLVCEQHRFNLISRDPAEELFPAANALGIGIVAFTPLFGGMLSGNVFKDISKGQRTSKYAGKLSPERLEQLRKYSELCAQLGESEADVAHAYILHDPNVTAPIIGPRTVEQLEATIHAVDIVLPEDFMSELKKLFPLGLAAPESKRPNLK